MVRTRRQRKLDAAREEAAKKQLASSLVACDVAAQQWALQFDKQLQLLMARLPEQLQQMSLQRFLELQLPHFEDYKRAESPCTARTVLRRSKSLDADRKPSASRLSCSTRRLQAVSMDRLPLQHCPDVYALTLMRWPKAQTQSNNNNNYMPRQKLGQQKPHEIQPELDPKLAVDLFNQMRMLNFHLYLNAKFPDKSCETN